MDDSRLDETHFWCIVTTLPKIRILIDSARDQTRDFGDLFEIGPEDKRKACGECRSRLHGWESKLGDVITASLSHSAGAGRSCIKLTCH